MKTRYLAWAAAVALAVTLTGCTAEQSQNSAGMDAANSPAATNGMGAANSPAVSNGMEQNSGRPDSSGGQTSPAVGGGSQGSTGMAGNGNDAAAPSAVPTPDVNDAEDGGGAGGTNDVDNDGKPETRAQIRAYTRMNGGLDDQGRMVDNAANDLGDAARDVGNAVRDTGDAIGNGIRDITR